MFDSGTHDLQQPIGVAGVWTRRFFIFGFWVYVWVTSVGSVTEWVSEKERESEWVSESVWETETSVRGVQQFLSDPPVVLRCSTSGCPQRWGSQSKPSQAPLPPPPSVLHRAVPPEGRAARRRPANSDASAPSPRGPEADKRHRRSCCSVPPRPVSLSADGRRRRDSSVVATAPKLKEPRSWTSDSRPVEPTTKKSKFFLFLFF